MKKIITLIVFILMYQVSFSQVWTQKSAVHSTNGGRATTAFAISSLGRGYTVGGAPYDYETWEYDTLLDTWIQRQNYPGGADGTQVAFSINGKGYVGTGVSFGCGIYNTFYEYDPVADSWTPLPNVPGPPRGYAVGFAVGGKGYIGGGITGCNGNGLNDFYSYDPTTNKWDTIAPYPGKGSGLEAVGFSIGNYGYVGTGDSVSSNGSSYTPQKDFWRYDPSSNTWTQMADFPGGVRGGASGFATCDKGFIGLGYSDNNQSVFHDDFYEYDPVKNKWTQIANYGGGSRSYTPAFVVGKSCYVGLGVASNNATQTDIWEYIPSYTAGFTADTAVCAGGTIAFTDTSNYGPTNWFWQFQGGTPDTSSSPNPTIKYSSSGSYDVTLTAWNGCDSSTKTFSKYVTVSAGFSVSVLPDSPFVCNGQHILLTAQGGTDFQWVGTSNSTDTITVNPLKDTTYELMVSNGTCSIDTFISVSVKLAPALIVQPPSPASVCLGEGVMLTVPISGTGYVWSPSLALNKSTGDTVIASPTSQTTYLVTGIDSLGCAVTSDSEVVMINTGPSKPTIMQHDSVLISSSTQSNQWLRNDTIIQGATNQDYIVTISGYYQVTVSNPANGCSTTSDSVLASGINQLTVESEQLTVYPNPTSGEIRVDISSSVMDLRDWNLQITDVLGRTLLTKSSLNYSNEIDLSNLSGGMYFISVVNKTGKVVIPVVKQ